MQLSGCGGLRHPIRHNSTVQLCDRKRPPQYSIPLYAEITGGLALWPQWFGVLRLCKHRFKKPYYCIISGLKQLTFVYISFVWICFLVVNGLELTRNNLWIVFLTCRFILKISFSMPAQIARLSSCTYPSRFSFLQTDIDRMSGIKLSSKWSMSRFAQLLRRRPSGKSSVPYSPLHHIFYWPKHALLLV